MKNFPELVPNVIDLETVDKIATKLVSLIISAPIGDACEDDCDCTGDPDSCGEGHCPIG